MNNKKIGALWLCTSRSGEKYMKGVLETNKGKFNIIVFKNNKELDKQPDYNIFLENKKQ